ncbi:tyrosine recombinase XerC [Clostridium manihotivorum]|uniref:Recombinase XerC n=1 Tax=Clostridium manihotivorum TaxID=2320868 RepID=A0A3R5QUY3_9CLOT|nr:tyrosine recombinase XerC [Clostridium manihotivorum]QAA32914.1 recombinase XerC [Clostridium manihotivorum]
MKYDIKAIQENNNLPPSVIDFINYLETIKGKSERTIEGYKFDLTVFFRFLKVYKGLCSSNVEFEEILLSDIDETFIRNIKLTDLYAFMSFVEKQRENGTYARARKVAALKSYFKFISTKAKIITEDPTIELETPKISKRHPVYLTLDQSINLLNSLDKKNKNYLRDYCILTLFLNCGLRLSELCNIQIDKIKNDILTIIGKGNKERTVYLNEASLDSINRYLQVRDASKCDGENKKFLFLSSRNKKIDKRTVEILVKKHITNSGLTEAKYTPHKLRHTAATLMYKYGNVDIRSLQQILGHESVSTTQIYTHIDDESLREAVKSNPLSQINKYNK